METLAVVWAVTHFRYYLYGHDVTIITDHAAILGAPNLTGKHARSWSKIYGNGINQVNIIHRSGKKNQHADCLSRQPVMPALPDDKDTNAEVQIAKISSEPKSSGEENNIDILLQSKPEVAEEVCSDTYSTEQLMDQELKPIILYLKDGTLSEDAKIAKKIVAESALYAIFDDILYYVGPKQTETSRVAVPQQLRQKIMMMDA